MVARPHLGLGVDAIPRRRREDCFFGLHFDLHPTAEDASLGRDLTNEMVEHLLESCKPDFIQYDSKGVYGYLGFPSKTGMSAPGIVKDSLEIWRGVTARHGVALYNHFCGLLDGLAVAKHPEWARVGPDGKRAEQETGLLSGYTEELMIPELEEVALKYDLDGSWVDGECWAVHPDYSEATRKFFEEKTGIERLPERPEDPGWNEFLEMHRVLFRAHVTRYLDALHRAKPGFEITSNWMYSTFVPERPTVGLDYLSGDMADQAAVSSARLQARYLGMASSGKPWDLMSWGFDAGNDLAGPMSGKPPAALEQEAAVVLAQGGAYQIYYVPTRSGWIDDKVIDAAAEVARFCRARQQASHRSQTVPEVGIIFSGRTLYRTSGKVFGWGSAESPAKGAIDLLLAGGYSVDLIPDWKAAECASQYPLVVVPDWKDLGEEVASVLTGYATGGGKLLLCGAENARLFAGALHLKLKVVEPSQERFVAGDGGFAALQGPWAEVDAPAEQVLMKAYRSVDTRKDASPLGIQMPLGKGTVIVCPGPLMSGYGTTRASVIRAVGRRFAALLHEPAVRFSSEHPEIEIVMRRKDGRMFIHLINLAGATVTGEFRSSGVALGTGPLNISVRLPLAASRVVLEPEGTELAGRYRDGRWNGTVPSLEIHSILGIEGEPV
jgi:hypothetical protein